MSPATLERERLVAIRAVRDAARVCRAVQAQLSPGLAATKSDRSPVTVADYASQALVSMALGEAFPADRIVGEETSAALRDGASPELAAAVLEQVQRTRSDVDFEAVCAALDRGGDAGGPTGRRWALDPVDGTKGFLRGQQYAVALALIEDGDVVLGVLACPNLNGGAMFVAERGGGAWQLPLDDEDRGSVTGGESSAPARAIHVSASTDIRGARYTESYESGHSSQGTAAQIAAALGMDPEPLRMDSQTKYAVVARGDAELYFRLPAGAYVEQIWDHAAGSIIVSEAGGTVSDIRGAPLDFSLGRRLERNRGVVVAPAALHAQVVAAVARTLEN